MNKEKRRKKKEERVQLKRWRDKRRLRRNKYRCNEGNIYLPLGL